MGFRGKGMAALMLSCGIRFAALGWLLLRFCAALVLGLAIVGAAIVVWAIAGLVVAVIGDEPQGEVRGAHGSLGSLRVAWERLPKRRRHRLAIGPLG
jgi:hypothetical protein